MLEDLFQLLEYQYRDSNKATIKEYAKDLIAIALSYTKARRAIRIKELRLIAKEYYNLITRDIKRTSSEELQYVLYTLKNKSFKVRIKKRYIINKNIRYSQKVKFFFFASPKQICIVR